MVISIAVRQQCINARVRAASGSNSMAKTAKQGHRTQKHPLQRERTASEKLHNAVRAAFKSWHRVPAVRQRLAEVLSKRIESTMGALPTTPPSTCTDDVVRQVLGRTAVDMWHRDRSDFESAIKQLYFGMLEEHAKSPVRANALNRARHVADRRNYESALSTALKHTRAQFEQRYLAHMLQCVTTDAGELSPADWMVVLAPCMAPTSATEVSRFGFHVVDAPILPEAALAQWNVHVLHTCYTLFGERVPRRLEFAYLLLDLHREAFAQQ